MSDDGVGMTSRRWPRSVPLFAEEHGTGLGLDVPVDAAGMTAIAIEPRGAGTHVTARLSAFREIRWRLMPRERILVVDDEPGMLRTIERPLHRCDMRAVGFRVRVSTPLAGSFDVAILDVRMPEMDGFAHGPAGAGRSRRDPDDGQHRRTGRPAVQAIRGVLLSHEAIRS